MENKPLQDYDRSSQSLLEISFILSKKNLKIILTSYGFLELRMIEDFHWIDIDWLLLRLSG